MSSPINIKRLSQQARKMVDRELCWARNASGTITVHLLLIHDYRRCPAIGGDVVTYIKRLSKRPPRCYHGRRVLFSPVWAQLPANLWHVVSARRQP